MSDDKEYKDGDIVWVKFGNNWWPAEVTDVQRQPDGLLKHLRRKPYCVVKFFQEDAYEYVKSSKQIFPFQCQRKEEFIKKGMALFEANNKFMEKFPSYVETAESLTCKSNETTITSEKRSSTITSPAVDTLIINNRPGDSIVKAILSQATVRHNNKSYDNTIPSARSALTTPAAANLIGKYRRNSITILNITPHRPAVPSTILTPAHNDKTPNNNNSGTTTTTKTPLSTGVYNSSVYVCNLCDFTSTRQNVMIFHRKSHSSTATATVTTPEVSAATKTIIPKANNDLTSVGILNVTPTTTKTITTTPAKTSLIEERLITTKPTSTSRIPQQKTILVKEKTISTKTTKDKTTTLATATATTKSIIPINVEKGNEITIIPNNKTKDEDDEEEEKLINSNRRNQRRSKSLKTSIKKNERKKVINYDDDHDDNNDDNNDVDYYKNGVGNDVQIMSNDISSSTTDINIVLTPTRKTTKTIIDVTDTIIITPTTTTTPTIGTSSGNSEELRQRLLADWSDEENMEDHQPHLYQNHCSNNINSKNDIDNSNGDVKSNNNKDGYDIDSDLIDKDMVIDDDDNNVNANNLKMSNETKTEVSKVISVVVDDNENNDNSNNNNNNNKKSLPRIRNIPKKDRRDVILTEFNERTSSSSSSAKATTTTTTTTLNAATDAAAPIVQIDTFSNLSSDSVVIVGELPAPVVVIKKNNLEHVVSATKSDKMEYIIDVADQSEDDNIKTNNASIDITPSKVLSCFDFRDEDEEEDMENDMLKSIANFKKKLQTNENNVKKATMMSLTKNDNNDNDNDNDDADADADNDKDNKLAEEIEILLEQSSTTVCNVQTLQQCTMKSRRSDSSSKEDIIGITGAKGLPIKERGKRIFKSRNHSHTEISNVQDIVEEQEQEQQQQQPQQKIELKIKATNEMNKEGKADASNNCTTNGEEQVVQEKKNNKMEICVSKEIPVKLMNATPAVVISTPIDENSTSSEAGAEFGSPTSMLEDERLPVVIEVLSKKCPEQEKINENIEDIDDNDEKSPTHEKLSGNKKEITRESLEKEEETISKPFKTNKLTEIRGKKRGHIKIIPRRQLNNNEKCAEKLFDFDNNNTTNSEKPTTTAASTTSSLRRKLSSDCVKPQKECQVLVKRTKLAINDLPKEIHEDIRKITTITEADTTVEEPLCSPIKKIISTASTTTTTTHGSVAGGENVKRCEVLLRKTKMPQHELVKKITSDNINANTHVTVSQKELKEEEEDQGKKERIQSNKNHKLLMTRRTNRGNAGGEMTNKKSPEHRRNVKILVSTNTTIPTTTIKDIPQIANSTISTSTATTTTTTTTHDISNLFDIQNMPLLAEKREQQQQQEEIILDESSNNKAELLTLINAKKTAKHNSKNLKHQTQLQQQHLPTERKSLHEEILKKVEDSPTIAKRMHKNEQQKQGETNKNDKEIKFENNKNNGKEKYLSLHDNDLNKKQITTSLSSSPASSCSKTSAAAAAATGGHKQSGSIALSSSNINKLHNNINNSNNNKSNNTNKNDQFEHNNKKSGGIKRKLAREQKFDADEAIDEVLSVKLSKTAENSNVILAQQQQQQQQQIKLLKQPKSIDTTTTTIPTTFTNKQRTGKKQQHNIVNLREREETEEEEEKTEEIVVVVKQMLNETTEKEDEEGEEEILTTEAKATTTVSNTFELDEQQSEQLMQVQNDEVETPKILAVPTQPIPGYNETFLLCTLDNNEYKPIDNVPLYLDNELNQLVPLPAEALLGQPEFIVNQPPPQSDEELQQQSIIKAVLTETGIPTPSTTLTATDITAQVFGSNGAQLMEVAAAAGVNVSTVMTPAIVSSNNNGNLMAINTDFADAMETDDEINMAVEDDMATEATTIFDADPENLQNAELIEMNEEMMMEDALPSSSNETEQIVADNAIILNIEGQQIIIDAATFAQLLENPDANTQLITDDGTEFVLTREVLAALETQHDAAQHALLQPDAASPSNDILAVALAGSDLYGSDILEIETSQGLQLVCSDGSLAFPPGAHLTPPITAHTSETNALLDQTPIMSALETPTSLAGNAGIGSKLQLIPTTAAELLTAGDEAIITPNLDDSLAVIGLTTQSSTIPTSLELPITVTNPAIAPKVSIAGVLPITDAIMQFSVQPSVSVIGTYNDQGS